MLKGRPYEWCRERARAPAPFWNPRARSPVERGAEPARSSQLSSSAPLAHPLGTAARAPRAHGVVHLRLCAGERTIAPRRDARQAVVVPPRASRRRLDGQDGGHLDPRRRCDPAPRRAGPVALAQADAPGPCLADCACRAPLAPPPSSSCRGTSTRMALTRCIPRSRSSGSLPSRSTRRWRPTSAVRRLPLLLVSLSAARREVNNG